MAKTKTPQHTTSKETSRQASDEYQELTREDLDRLAGEALPERAAMSLINANVAAPVNLALAANVLSDNSIAYAEATQDVDVDQSN